MFAAACSTNLAPASSGVVLPNATSSAIFFSRKAFSPAPFGGGGGKAPTIGVSSAMYSTTSFALASRVGAMASRIFAEAGTIFVYATTEPSEALLLGGNTATLSEGKVTQFGKTIDVFRRPDDLVTARTFSDPPLNTIAMRKTDGHLVLDGGTSLPVPAHLGDVADGIYTVGFQPHHLSLSPGGAAVSIRSKVIAMEITGSESFVHLNYADERWVMLTPGIRKFEADETIEVFLDPQLLLVFDGQGRSVTNRLPMTA